MAAILCLLCLCAVGAQERKVQHRPYIDQRRFHYGFLFGVHVQDLELQNNGYIDPESTTISQAAYGDLATQFGEMYTNPSCRVFGCNLNITF